MKMISFQQQFQQSQSKEFGHFVLLKKD